MHSASQSIAQFIFRSNCYGEGYHEEWIFTDDIQLILYFTPIRVSLYLNNLLYSTFLV